MGEREGERGGGREGREGGKERCCTCQVCMVITNSLPQQYLALEEGGREGGRKQGRNGEERKRGGGQRKKSKCIVHAKFAR